MKFKRNHSYSFVFNNLNVVFLDIISEMYTCLYKNFTHHEDFNNFLFKQ